MQFLILPLLFGAMWWFTIRPQQQRLRQQRALIAAITVGDVVLTAGGLIGRITSMDDDEVMLDVGRGTLEKVAESRDDFAKKSDEDDNANQWLMIPLIDRPWKGFVILSIAGAGTGAFFPASPVLFIAQRRIDSSPIPTTR